MDRTLSRALLFGILLLSLALRLAPWDHNRFLEDEALYAYWGLQIATGADPLLDDEPVDKPPLHPYLLAASFLLAGSTAGGRAAETAARLPSLLASVAGVALVYALGRELTHRGANNPLPWREGAGGGWPLLAALLVALSPFDLLFASTAFTDPLLVALVLAALLAAARGRAGTAGLFAALAAATKQQGLLFLPLILTFLLLQPEPRAAIPCSPVPGTRFLVCLLLRFLLPFAAVTAAVLAWDVARVQRPGFWQQGLVAYGGLAPAGVGALAARAGDWLRLAGSFWGSTLFNGLALAALLAWAAGAVLARASKRRQAARSVPDNHGRVGPDLALALFVAAFLLLHWLVGFQVWDRYLLGLVPLCALLLARGLAAVGRRLSPPAALVPGRRPRPYALALGLVLALAAGGPAVRAAHSALPLGGDHGAYDGIDELAAMIRAEAPAGAVLYHHWLGYHYRFYLYGAPLRLHWYPDVQDLAHDAYVYRREARYIAFPSFRDGEPARAALAAAGVELLPVGQTHRRDGTISFRLYRLIGPPVDETGSRDQVPGSRDQVPGTRYLGSGTWDQVPGTGYLIPDTRSLIPDTRSLIPATRSPIPSAGSLAACKAVA